MNKIKIAISILILLMSIFVASIAAVVPADASSNDTWIPKEYVGYCEEIGNKYHICPELLEAMIEKESSGNPNAVNGTCKGLLQISENVHQDRMKRLGVTNLYDPYQNITVGADLVLEIFEEYADTDFNGTIEIILMRYNGVSQAEAKAKRGEYNKYATDIVKRSAELERIHGK